jgi:hypothetical protein
MRRLRWWEVFGFSRGVDKGKGSERREDGMGRDRHLEDYISSLHAKKAQKLR